MEAIILQQMKEVGNIRYYSGVGFPSPEELKKFIDRRNDVVKDSLIIVNGTLYDSKDIEQALVDAR